MRIPLVLGTALLVAACAIGRRKADTPAQHPLADLLVFVDDRVEVKHTGNFDPKLDTRLHAALQAELSKAGLLIVGPDRGPDVHLHLKSTVHGGGVVTLGTAKLTVERDGVVLDMFEVSTRLTSESGFVSTSAQRLAAALVRSPAVLAVAERKRARQSPKPAAGQPTDADIELAKTRTQHGKRFFDLGHYEKALKEYEAAYLTVAHPALLFNIGQCHNKLGHNEEAIRSYRSYVRDAPDAPNRSAVEREIQSLEATSQKP